MSAEFPPGAFALMVARGQDRMTNVRRPPLIIEIDEGIVPYDPDPFLTTWMRARLLDRAARNINAPIRWLDPGPPPPPRPWPIRLWARLARFTWNTRSRLAEWIDPGIGPYRG